MIISVFDIAYLPEVQFLTLQTVFLVNNDEYFLPVGQNLVFLPVPLALPGSLGHLCPDRSKRLLGLEPPFRCETGRVLT